MIGITKQEEFALLIVSELNSKNFDQMDAGFHLI
jgi:hypothetical protein